jgi:hypothetical protein
MSGNSPEPPTQTDATTGTDRAPPENGGATAEDEQLDRVDLEARLDLLTEENRRLRREYTRVRTTQYRRTAFGLASIGAIATLAGGLFPGARTVLFVLGAIGLFGGLLTYYLTPERFIPATVGERVYTAFAATAEGIVTELGLSTTRVYVPTDDTTRLFVPQQDVFELPATDALVETFVATTDDNARGVTTDPTGARLFQEFDRVRSGPLADGRRSLADQLVEALVEQFELVDSVRVELDSETDRVVFGITGSNYGAVDRFDHPVASFLAVGLARGLDTPMTVSVTQGDDRAAFVVTVSRVDTND